MLQHYVEFLYAGAFISETSTKKIESREQKVNMPKGAYAYRFFDKEETSINGEKLEGKPKNFSKMFIMGEVYSLDRVEKEMPHKTILIENMRCNKWDKVIKCAQGFIPFDEKDMQLIN